MEQIKTTTPNNIGSISYYFSDNDLGVPYTSITVLENGDYFCTVYGSLCFKRSSHEKLISFAKPTGNDITAQKHFNR